MRCPDCNKFVSYDTEQDPEVESEDVDGEGTFTASIRRVLTCGECGADLKETTFDIEQSADVPAKCEKNDGGAHDFSVLECSASPTERTQTKDRHGKPIKSARYMKHFYGIEGEAQIKCDHCDHEVTVQFSDEAQASSFDELT